MGLSLSLRSGLRGELLLQAEMVQRSPGAAYPHRIKCTKKLLGTVALDRVSALPAPPTSSAHLAQTWSNRTQPASTMATFVAALPRQHLVPQRIELLRASNLPALTVRALGAGEVAICGCPDSEPTTRL